MFNISNNYFNIFIINVISFLLGYQRWLCYLYFLLFSFVELLFEFRSLTTFVDYILPAFAFENMCWFLELNHARWDLDVYDVCKFRSRSCWFCVADFDLEPFVGWDFNLELLVNFNFNLYPGNVCSSQILIWNNSSIRLRFRLCSQISIQKLIFKFRCSLWFTRRFKFENVCRLRFSFLYI